MKATHLPRTPPAMRLSKDRVGKSAAIRICRSRERKNTTTDPNIVATTRTPPTPTMNDPSHLRVEAVGPWISFSSARPLMATIRTETKACSLSIAPGRTACPPTSEWTRRWWEEASLVRPSSKRTSSRKASQDASSRNPEPLMSVCRRKTERGARRMPNRPIITTSELWKRQKPLKIPSK